MNIVEMFKTDPNSLVGLVYKYEGYICIIDSIDDRTYYGTFCNDSNDVDGFWVHLDDFLKCEQPMITEVYGKGQHLMDLILI
jgi:hypothetical protein